MYVTASDTIINPTNVAQWLQFFKSNIMTKYQNLEEYYQGNDFLNKVTTELDKSNKRNPNNIHSNLARMIVNNACGYFMGKPVTYSFKEGKFEKEVRALLWKNEEQAENMTLSKTASKYGVAYELMGINRSKEIYIKALSPLSTFYVVDDTVLQDKVCAITFWTTTLSDQTTRTKGYVYTPNEIIPFEGETAFTFGKPELNPFKPCIPVFEFKNNDESIGDFEPVTELLSAYSKLLSTNFDDIDSIANSILALMNAQINQDDKKELKKSRILQLIGERADIKYVNKSIDKEYAEYVRNALREDIFSISNVPDFTDEKFAGNQSGVALSYKLLGFENLRLTKKNYFEKGLFQRLQCFLNFKKMMNIAEQIPEGEVEITFYANVPSNIDKDKQIADLYNAGVLSRKTALERMETVDDVDEELKRIAEEQPDLEDLDGQTGAETGHQGQ